MKVNSATLTSFKDQIQKDNMVIEKEKMVEGYHEKPDLDIGVGKGIFPKMDYHLLEFIIGINGNQ